MIVSKADVDGVPDSSATVQTQRESRDLPIGSACAASRFAITFRWTLVRHQGRLQRKDATTIVGMSEPRQLDIRLDGRRLRLFTLADLAAARGDLDDGLEVRIPVAPDRTRCQTFVKDTVKPEGVLDRAGTRRSSRVLAAYRLRVRAPDRLWRHRKPPEDFRVPSTPKSDEDACATRIITTLARRAYRRPITRKRFPH